MSKAAKEISIFCPCGRGALIRTTLEDQRGIPVVLYLTEYEKIYMRGTCSACGKEIDSQFSILSLLFDCPKAREVQ